MKDERLIFYRSISTNSEIYYSHVDGIEDAVEWIGLFEFENEQKKERLGITNKGVWIIENRNGIYLLDVFKNYLYCMSILELPAQFIIEEIQNKFENSVEKHSICALFPFYEILEFALSNMKDDYWFELAMMWYEILEDGEKKKLESFLLAICENKKFSQKNRQTAYNKIKLLQ